MSFGVFFAHKIGFTGCDDNGRYEVLFEAVPAELINMFILGELDTQMSEEGNGFLANSQFFGRAWECLQEFGLGNEEFQQFLSFYLAEVPDFEIVLLFQDFSQAMQLEEDEDGWFEIVLNLNGSIQGSPISALCSLVPEEELLDNEFEVLSFRNLSMEENISLYNFYLGAGEQLQNNRDDNVRRKNKETLGEIRPDTVFGKVQVLYVGAGLSCRLLDYTGNVVGYFDMGQELTLSATKLLRRSQAAYPVLNQKKQDSINIMKQDAQAGTAMTVIISHWHYDHVKVLGDIAREYLQTGNYNGFWSNLNIICPAMMRNCGWAVTDYNRIIAALAAANNQAGFHPEQNVMVSQTRTVNLGQNINLYKGDIGGNGHSRKVLHHAHNHGLAAVIHLTGTNNWIFLPGDCSYDTIDGVQGLMDRGGLGYEYLVATHHGGTYTHNEQSNPAVLPVPNGQLTSKLVYSANGVAYGHPDPAVMANYQNKNWVNCALLHQLCQTGQYGWYELI